MGQKSSHPRCTLRMSNVTSTIHIAALWNDLVCTVALETHTVINVWRVGPLGKDVSCAGLWKGHTAPIRHLLANGPRLFSSSDDRTVRAWSSDGRCTTILQLGAEVGTCALGSGMLCAAISRRLVCWDVGSASLLGSVLGTHDRAHPSHAPSGPGTSVVLYAIAAHDGCVFIAQGDSSPVIRWLNAKAALDARRRILGGARTAAQVGADGSEPVVVGGSADAAACPSLETQEGVLPLQHTRRIVALALREDRLFSVSMDGLACVWDVASTDAVVCLATLRHKLSLVGLCLSDAGGRLYTASLERIFVWDVVKYKKVSEWDAGYAMTPAHLTWIGLQNHLVFTAGQYLSIWDFSEVGAVHDAPREVASSVLISSFQAEVARLERRTVPSP